MSTKEPLLHQENAMKKVMAGLIVVLAAAAPASGDVILEFSHDVAVTNLRNLNTLTLDFSVDGVGNVTLNATTSNAGGGGGEVGNIVNAWDGVVGTVSAASLFNSSFSIVGLGSGGAIATTTGKEGLGVGNAVINNAGTEDINWTINLPGTETLVVKTFSYSNRVAFGTSNLRLEDSDTGVNFPLPSPASNGGNDFGTVDVSGDGFALTDTQVFTVTTDPNQNAAAGASLFGFSFDVVPEPGSLALLSLGGLCVLRRRRD